MPAIESEKKKGSSYFGPETFHLEGFGGYWPLSSFSYAIAQRGGLPFSTKAPEGVCTKALAW